MSVHLLGRQIFDMTWYDDLWIFWYVLCCNKQGSYLPLFWDHLATSGNGAFSILSCSLLYRQRICFCFPLVHLNVCAYNCPKVLHVRASPGFGVFAQLEHYFQAASFRLGDQVTVCIVILCIVYYDIWWVDLDKDVSKYILQIPEYS